jgi:ActR/RegA family two-component response regulator
MIKVFRARIQRGLEFRMRLLIIEDEEKLRNTLSAYMSERGIFTDTAADGQDGLYYAQKGYYAAGYERP